MSSPNLTSILLIDDDEISNLFNKIFISKLNVDVEVEIVLNGKDAIDFITSLTKTPNTTLPCLLLLDIKMPIMDGWQFLDAYETNVSQEIKDNIVIVMLTTSEDEGDFIKAMKNPNINEFIQKPLSEEIFNKLIDAHFNNENC